MLLLRFVKGNSQKGGVAGGAAGREGEVHQKEGGGGECRNGLKNLKEGLIEIRLARAELKQRRNRSLVGKTHEGGAITHGTLRKSLQFTSDGKGRKGRRKGVCAIIYLSGRGGKKKERTFEKKKCFL